MENINFEFTSNDLLFSSDKSKLDISYIHSILLTSYWAKSIPMDRLVKSITNSLCYGLYNNNKQIGFARVITDYSQDALIEDVFIDPEYSRQGYGKFLIKSVIESPITKDCFRWVLMTKDAQSFYSKFGFKNNEFTMFKLLESGF